MKTITPYMTTQSAFVAVIIAKKRFMMSGGVFQTLVNRS